jgi:spore maturation protein CgeB
MHSRVLDVMGSGGVALVHQSADDKETLNKYFTPFVHYIPFTLTNMEEVIDKCINDIPALISMGNKAREVIREGHTWQHRARQILKDLK